MALTELSLLAVFLTGLLGGVHCAGMCGGIVSALGMSVQGTAAKVLDIPVTVVKRTGTGQMGVSGAQGMVGASAMSPIGASNLSRSLVQFRPLVGYNLGRVSTYTILGAIAGAVGSAAWLMQSVLPVQQTAFFLSNILLIAMGLYLMGFKYIGAVLESVGQVVWRRIKPAATARLTGSGFVNAFVAGSFWGLVPCGMVYAVLGAALVSGSFQQGALLMLIFGLGTLPNLLLLGISGQWLAKASRHRLVRLFAGAMIIAFGLMGLMHLSMSGTHATGMHG